MNSLNFQKVMFSYFLLVLFFTFFTVLFAIVKLIIADL